MFLYYIMSFINILQIFINSINVKLINKNIEFFKLQNNAYSYIDKEIDYMYIIDSSKNKHKTHYMTPNTT